MRLLVVNALDKISLAFHDVVAVVVGERWSAWNSAYEACAEVGAMCEEEHPRMKPAVQ